MNRLSEDDLISRLRNISLPKENAPAPRVASNFAPTQPPLLAVDKKPKARTREERRLPREGERLPAGPGGAMSSRSMDSLGPTPRREPAPAVLLGRKMSASRVGSKLGDKVTPRRANKLGHQLSSGKREPPKRRDILRTKLTAEEILDGLKAKYDFNETLEYMEAAQDFVQSTEAMREVDAEPLLIPEVGALPPPLEEKEADSAGPGDSAGGVGPQPSVESSVGSGQSPYVQSHFSHGREHSIASTKSSQRRKKDPTHHKPQLFFHRIDQTPQEAEAAAAAAAAEAAATAAHATAAAALPEVRPGTAERNAATLEARVPLSGEVWSDVVALNGVPVLLALHQDFARLPPAAATDGERDEQDLVIEAQDLPDRAEAGGASGGGAGIPSSSSSAALLRRSELEGIGLGNLKSLGVMPPAAKAPVVQRLLPHLSMAPVPGKLSEVQLTFRPVQSRGADGRPKTPEEFFVDGMLSSAAAGMVASADLVSSALNQAVIGGVVRPELSVGSTIETATGMTSPVPPIIGINDSSGDERFGGSSDSEQSLGSQGRKRSLQRRPGDRQLGTFSDRARRRRKRERQLAAREEDKYYNRPKEASSWDYDNNGYLWTHEQEEEDRRQPGYRSVAQRAAVKREHDMEHAYRMKGRGGPAINDAGALSSAARQEPPPPAAASGGRPRRGGAGSGTRGGAGSGTRGGAGSGTRSGAGSGTRSGAGSARRTEASQQQQQQQQQQQKQQGRRRPRSRDRGDSSARSGPRSHRPGLPSVGVGKAMRSLDDQLDDLFARDSDRLDRSGRISDSQYIAKAHEEDLLRRGYLQRRRERGDQIKTLNSIENITKTLPMAFLVEKGIGDLTVQHSFNIMVNVVNRALNAEMKAAWVVWRTFVNALNRAEFMARANRFQQEEGLTLLKRVMKRMLRARIGHRFHAWHAATQKMADVATAALQEEMAALIQRNFRIFLAHQKGVEFFKKMVRKKKQQAKDMANLSAWIHNRSRMIGRHRRNKKRRAAEDQAAHMIIKNFRTKQGVKYMIKRIKATQARKAAELLALRIKSANTLQRWCHWYRCWYWPLEVRFRNRKRLLRMIKLGLITQAEASASSASDGEGEAEIIVDYELPAIEIQRAYRKRLQWIALISRFPRRKQLLEAERFAAHLHLMAQRPQRMFRAYRLRFFLRHRISARLFVSYRLVQPSMVRSAAAVLIQRPFRNVMGREKLNFMFAARKVVMEAQYQKDLLAAAILVQQAWRKSQGRYSEFILQRARAAKAAARAAMEEEKRKREIYMKAVLKMQRNYRLSTGRFNLAQRFKDRRRQMSEQKLADRREAATLSIQKQWRVHRGRTGIALQIEARKFKAKDEIRLAIFAKSTAMISRAGRRKGEWKQITARFDRRTTLKRVQQDRQTRHDKANIIIGAWIACNWRFNRPIRVVSRYESVKKVREARRLRQWQLEDKSARFIQRSWIHRRSRILLQEMFDRRAEILAAARRYKLEMEMSKVIGFAVRRYQDRERVKMRTQYRRIQIAAQRLSNHRIRAASQIQSCWHKYLNRVMLWRKFQARREELEAQDLQQRRVLEAKIAAQQARDAQDAARAALKQMEFAGWKMGADDHGRNYYYNLITGETQFEKPEGWVPPAEELWVKNTTSSGLTYYFNQLSGETAWFPPCDECKQNEGKKICFDCPGTYCPGCFNKRHYPCCDPDKVDSSVRPPHHGCVTDDNGKKMCEHIWKGADQDKEELGMGEVHCQKCQTRKAVRTSKLSRESFCLECFLDLHNTPWTSQIEWIPYEEFKKGWQEIKGRNPGDQDYYFNPMTRQETYEKPMDLMNPEEKKEHVKYKQYEKASEKYVKKIDKLQHHIETLEYEKDTAFFEAQKKATLEQEELEALRELLQLREDKQKKVSWLTILKNPLKFYFDKKRREARERALYRKQLLLSKKQRAEAAKKEAAELAANAGGGGDDGGEGEGGERPKSPEAGTG